MPERLGPYELHGELGRGAMARVWRAWDPNRQREVAIKEPLFDPRLSQAVLNEMARRFVAEGRAASQLSHPNIVSVYETDVWDGRPAIVMELVEGKTLADLIDAGALPASWVLTILDQLLDAVGYAHACGIVHRDIKPDNVFVSREGVVKLADFGVAHLEGAATRLTAAGAVIGTPGYMSPEQALGRPVDARSDLFSIGVVAYEMLTGSNPFGASGGTDATTLIYRIVHEPAPELRGWVPSCPEPMAAAIMAALEKDPAARPQSAGEFRAMLHRGETRAPMAYVEEAPVPTSAGGSADRRPSWIPLAAVALVCAVGLVAAFMSSTSGIGGGGGGTSAAASGASTSVSTTSTTSTPTSQTYTLGLDDNMLAVRDESGAVVEGGEADVSYLPLKDVARLELGVSYTSYDDALEAYQSLSNDATPAAAWTTAVDALPQPSVAASADSRTSPFWGIVIGEFINKDEALNMARACESEYGVSCEVVHQLDWQGLLAHYDAAGVAESGDSYLVLTGCSDTYRKLVENYLAMAELMGQQLGSDATAIIESTDNWKLIDEMGDDIRFSGSCRRANG